MKLSLHNSRLLTFNRSIVEQAQRVISALAVQPQIAFAEYVGPHLRHILEHYEALLAAVDNSDSLVNYDNRPRDRAAEQDAAIMSERYASIAGIIAHWDDEIILGRVRIHLQGGLTGEFDFVTESTVGREMMFLASHAIHHFALIQFYCLQHGISMEADFGKAPSTIAYERS